MMAGRSSGLKRLKTFQRRQDGLARHQRALERKKRGSKRRSEAVRKVVAYEGRTAAIRRHRLHGVTNQLVKNHDLLVIENLNVLGMMANHKLAKALADASFGTIARMLTYKAGWYGATLLSADRFYPNAETCSGCGARKKKLALSERLFCCDECGLRIDRDLNSAINLARLVAVLLERPGRGSSPGSGPASGRPGQVIRDPGLEASPAE